MEPDEGIQVLPGENTSVLVQSFFSQPENILFTEGFPYAGRVKKYGVVFRIPKHFFQKGDPGGIQWRANQDENAIRFLNFWSFHSNAFSFCASVDTS